MCSSTSTAERTAKTAFICKMAFCSIPRCGAVALLLLTLGFYTLFPCISTLLQVQKETGAAYDLSVTAEDASFSLQELSQVEGVRKATPVCRIQGTLSTGDYSQNLEILGVFSNFLNLDFIQGGVFQDNTYMPFLVMNEAAAKNFSLVEDASGLPTTAVDIDTKLILKDEAGERDALIGGIFRDESDVPLCYMSYDTAKRALSPTEQTEFLLTLAHKGDSPKVAKELRRWKVQASLDENEILRWKLVKGQCYQLLGTALAGFLSAAVLIRKQHTLDTLKEQEEAAVLLSAGISARNLAWIYPLRILLAVLCSLVAAVSLAAIFWITKG